MSTELPTPSITDRAAAQARIEITVNNLLTYARLLQAALVRYGTHVPGCTRVSGISGTCDCGFTAALHGLIPREQHPAAPSRAPGRRRPRRRAGWTTTAPPSP
jgi:hypothetical protein